MRITDHPYFWEFYDDNEFQKRCFVLNGVNVPLRAKSLTAFLKFIVIIKFPEVWVVATNMLTLCW